ncbi:2OG-Fe(II) oxygenase [Nocardia sp. NPDC004068]|uniref:2OG-Fe(II) oxygenase n=1 Tax=Nocardia sp. NPDC004068 TaxID=3364303 RepID=UPI00367FA641
MSLFRWTTYDVRSLLPHDWQAQIMRVVQEETIDRTLISAHSTSREATHWEMIQCGGVGGRIVRTRLPWLYKLYEGPFFDLAQMMSPERVSLMADERFAVVLNVQRGHERYECHVDTNPIEALLYCTSHFSGEGGELVVSNLGDVHSIEEVEKDCAVIEPRAGQLVFFDAREHSHYVRPLTDSGAVRVVAAMNYYTESHPEQVRPIDLNRHLTGQD